MTKRLPATPETKARVARQSLTVKQIPIGNEATTHLHSLSHIRCFAPVNAFACGLIEEFAAAYRHFRSAWAPETEMFENAMQKHTARRQLVSRNAAFAELAAQTSLTSSSEPKATSISCTSEASTAK